MIILCISADSFISRGAALLPNTGNSAANSVNHFSSIGSQHLRLSIFLWIHISYDDIIFLVYFNFSIPEVKLCTMNF